ncbi:carboxymuconolactone decarboxylase family protein [Nocardia blacklockiae]|uniref:carboxymuconolactone decarboxylase family protein n=1 Tax=Nocardia blacklockiae TaxID=480036 RepID=UPI0018960E62|nr:carboxymuconolactone decarboxylase family protein [Nocardia blacklockiae]MBF6169970.1 carboxymuconolactone decarboxylase family protein [Nocardia blacklockiae]
MRVPPLPDDQWDDRTRAALRPLLPRARRNPAGAGPAMSTLVRHPDLTEAFLNFGVYLLFRSTLPPRIRELAVLRVAHLSGCAYEWQSHVDIAPQVGLTDADIDGIRRGRLADAFEQTVLDAVAELRERSQLSDAVWDELGERLDEQQRMDLIFTVGGYGLMAMAFNTFGVEPKPGGHDAVPIDTRRNDREQVV